MTVIHGYKPTDRQCPHCGCSYGALETTDNPAVNRYRCWCGATCMVTAEPVSS